jgi:hypothetical protein
MSEQTKKFGDSNAQQIIQLKQSVSNLNNVFISVNNCTKQRNGFFICKDLKQESLGMTKRRLV